MSSDVTQSEAFYKAWTWFETHKKQVGYGVVAVLVIGLIIGFTAYQRGQKRQQAEEALSRVFVPQATGAAAPEQAAGEYLKVANDYPKSSAGPRALLLGAASLYNAGKFGEAQQQFEKFVREYRDNALLGQAQLGLAASLEAQGKTNEAVTAYKVVVDRRSNENVATPARFSLANLYVAQNKPELALPLYEELAESNPYGAMGSEAGMRAEELKAKHPELAPAPQVQMTPVAPGMETLFLTNSTAVLPSSTTSSVPVTGAASTTNAAPAEPQQQ